MSTLKNLLKAIFPAPANSMHQRFDRMENELSASTQQIHEALDLMNTLRLEQDRMRRLLEKSNQMLCYMSDSMSELSRTADKRQTEWILFTQQTKESLDALECKLSNTDNKLCSLLYEIGVNSDKIEALQGLMQSNMLKSAMSYERSYLYQYIKKVRSCFPVMDVDGVDHRFIRIGKSNDGGYVMLEDFSDAMAAYSIGIADDVSWDKEMANRGLQVFMYDHTVQGLPESHDNFHFFKTGLAGSYSKEQPELKTLDMLIEENGHSNEDGMILKIDIEGCEWDVLNKIDEGTLNHFSQIVFEFHNLIYPKMESQVIPALNKLNRTHQLVHIHANNYGAYLMLNGQVLPELIEATYVRKGKYSFKKSERFFPTELDQINNIRRPEIILGTWN